MKTLSSLIITYSAITNANELFEFSKYPESYQPSGSIQDNYLMENPQVTFYKTKYKRHTDFTLETSDNNNIFGKTFTFTPLNVFCNSEFEKDNAKLCFTYHPYDWNCIYDNCISLSRTIPHYIKIVLPPIYYNNETTKQCFF